MLFGGEVLSGTQDLVVWQEGSGDLKYCVHDWLSFSTYNL